MYSEEIYTINSEIMYVRQGYMDLDLFAFALKEKIEERKISRLCVKSKLAAVFN